MKLLSSLLFALVFSFGFMQTASAIGSNTKANVKQSMQQHKQVNLNKAGVAELADTLTGVGVKKAQAIIAYRKKHGNFKAIEELASVKGIGPATIAKNYQRILL